MVVGDIGHGLGLKTKILRHKMNIEFVTFLFEAHGSCMGPQAIMQSLNRESLSFELNMVAILLFGALGIVVMDMGVVYG